MPATKVGIIYSIAQRRRRWMVVPDNDAELPLIPRVGEAYIEQSMVDYHQRGPDAAVADATGGAPLSDRCACVDKNGIVQMHCRADPTIDTLSGYTLVQSTISIDGDTFANAIFTRRYAQISHTGQVTSIVFSNALAPPVAANIGGFVMATITNQVGDTIAVVGSGT